MLARIAQAKVPILLGVAAAALVAATLALNDRRECRQLCVKHRFADGAYRIVGGGCQCVTADGTLVPAPQPERR